LKLKRESILNPTAKGNVILQSRPSLSAEEMPDATPPMIFMEIPGLNISSSKDIRANETVGWVVFLKSGSSMIDFHSWFEKTILHEHWKLIREQRLKLHTHNTISDDECMQIWLDSDITNIKFVTGAVNMAESRNNGLMYAKEAVSNAEYRLKELLTVNKRPPALSLILQRQPKKRKCNIPIKTNKLEVFHATIKPKDGQLFTVCFEIVSNYMLVDMSTPIFGEPTNQVHKFLMDKHVIGFTSRATLHRVVKNYNESKILPKEGCDGMKVGRPHKIDKENIALLNNTLHKNVGMIQGSSLLTQDLLELSSQQRTKRGIDTSFETPACSNATRKLYNLDASTQLGISLVKPSSTKVTGSRRQTAAYFA
jgi:hypothetical protein